MAPIPDTTLRALAHTLLTQGASYGFSFQDWVRFVSVLLDEALEARPLPQTSAGSLPLIGEHVQVRTVLPTDRPLLQAWCTDPRGRYFLSSRSTGRAHSVDDLLDDPRSVLGVVTLPSGRPVGLVGYLQVDREQGRAELRKLIGEPSLRGRGLGTEAARLWVGHGIHALGLRKIFLYTLATNSENVRLNQRLGFRVEGVLRDEVVIDDVAHDLLRMGLVVEMLTAGR